MRRKPGTILPLESSIIRAAIGLRGRGADEFHGFQIAKLIRQRDEARLLTAYGTLYRALERMEEAGLLTSRWEQPTLAARARRPRRRLYRVTAAGARALAAAPSSTQEHRVQMTPQATEA